MVGGDLPGFFVVIVAVVISVATVAGQLDWAVLRSRPGGVAVLTIAALTGFVTWRWHQRGTLKDRGLRSLALAMPALVVVAAAVVGTLRGVPLGLEWFLNGDHPRHVVYVADTWAQGNLSYAVEAYPRGWHSALAAAWSVVGAGLHGAGVVHLLEVMAAASLLLSALLALGLAHLGHALGIRAGLSRDGSVCVGVIVGGLSLLNVFLANYQALGYENSLLSAVALVACGREVLLRAGSTIALVVCASGVLVVAHSWQLLLPSAALAALWCAVVTLRSHAAGPRRALVVLVPLTLAMAMPAFVAVVGSVGLEHAAEVGPRSPVPVAFLTLGLVALLGLTVARRDPAMTCLAVFTALPAVTALGLAAGLGLDLMRYYPSKLLWQTSLLVVSWLVVACALGLRAVVSHATTASAVRVAVGTTVGLLLIYAAVQPWGAQAGAWSTVDGRRVIAAVTAPGASNAKVVWLEDTLTTDAVTRSLLDVFRVEQTQKRSPQARVSIAEECGSLRAADRPVVLSTASEGDVRRRYSSCSSTLEILRVAVD